MIKLIASDMDGTLLKEGTTQINPEILDVILKLKEKGIVFAAASGRQYDSMWPVFEPIMNDMIFIAENGGYVMCRGREMECCPFERPVLEDIVSYMRAQKDCQTMVNAPRMAYTDSRDQDYVRDVKGYGILMTQVEDVLAIKEPIVKAAMYCPIDAVKAAAPAIQYFQGRVNVMASGSRWVDFVPASVDKGKALQKIQQIMHIKKEETMAFGDNHNDIGMLNCAGESYAVANAREEVKRAARHVTDENTRDGVLKVLRTLL